MSILALLVLLTVSTALAYPLQVSLQVPLLAIGLFQVQVLVEVQQASHSNTSAVGASVGLPL